MAGLIGKYVGRYHIGEQLFRGGMATVYRAFDTRLKREVAFKMIRVDKVKPEQLDDMRTRFEREVSSLAKLAQHSIVNIFDYGELHGTPFLVMEYLPGGTLKAHTGKPIRVDIAVSVLLPIARALDYAHRQGIIHCDVKPANIIFSDEGAPMLSDFGIARVLDMEQSSEPSDSGTNFGTLAYMAPEQLSGRAVPQSDIYSLGVVFYELVTGRRPFIGASPRRMMEMIVNDLPPSPREFKQDLPQAVENVLYKMLAKAPGARYASMVDLIAAMEELLTLSEERNGPTPTVVQALVEIAEDLEVIGSRRSAIETYQRALSLCPPDSEEALEIQEALNSIQDSFSGFVAPQPVEEEKAPEEPAQDEDSEMESEPESRIERIRQYIRQHWKILLALAGVLAAYILIGNLWMARFKGLLAVFEPQEITKAPIKQAVVPQPDLPPGAVERLGRGIINDIALSPDKRYLVVTGGIGLHLYDLKTLDLRWYRTGPQQLYSAAFWPSEETLITARQGSVIRWDSTNGAQIGEDTFNGLSGPTAAFAPGGNFLASASDSNTAAVWYMNSGVQLHTLEGQQAPVSALAFSPGCSLSAAAGTCLVAAASEDNTAAIWDIDGPVLLYRFIRHEAPLTAAAFSPNGLALATASLDARVIVWDIDSGGKLRELSHTHAVTGLAYADDGSLLASGTSNGDIILWDPTEGTQVQLIHADSTAINRLRFSADGSMLAAATLHSISLWDPISGTKLGVLEDHSAARGFVVFAPNCKNPLEQDAADGCVLATQGGDSTLVYWDLSLHPPQRNTPGSIDQIPQAAGLSGDWSMLSASAEDGALTLWDTLSGEQLHTLQAGSRGPGLVFRSFSADGSLLAATQDRSILLWDTASGEQVRTLKGTSSQVEQITFSPDGRYLAVAGGENPVLVWNARSGTLPRKFWGHNDMLYSVVFSADSSMMVSTSADQTAILWDPDSGERLQTLRGHSGAVLQSAISPQGDLVATASEDHLIILWDTVSGNQLATLEGHAGAVFSLAFSPDGSLLASASQDGSILLWEMEMEMDKGK